MLNILYFLSFYIAIVMQVNLPLLLIILWTFFNPMITYSSIALEFTPLRFYHFILSCRIVIQLPHSIILSNFSYNHFISSCWRMDLFITSIFYFFGLIWSIFTLFILYSNRCPTQLFSYNHWISLCSSDSLRIPSPFPLTIHPQSNSLFFWVCLFKYSNRYVFASS